MSARVVAEVEVSKSTWSSALTDVIRTRGFGYQCDMVQVRMQKVQKVQKVPKVQMVQMVQSSRHVRHLGLSCSYCSFFFLSFKYLQHPKARQAAPQIADMMIAA